MQLLPMKTTEAMSIGIVLERHCSENPWLEYSWKSIAVIPGTTAMQNWREMGSGPGWVRFFGTTLELYLHKGETEGYRVNLSQAEPSIYIVLHNPTEKLPKPVLVTACPFEAEDNDVSGDEQVDRVPMPVEILSFVGHFVEQHHTEQSFKKRKRKKYFSGNSEADTVTRRRKKNG